MRSAETVRPVMDALFEWLHTMEDSVDRSSLIGDAILYTLNQEAYQKRYLEDGHLSIDNNRTCIEKLCSGTPQLAVLPCQKCGSWCQCPCLQHYRNGTSEPSETIRVSDLYIG